MTDMLERYATSSEEDKPLKMGIDGTAILDAYSKGLNLVDPAEYGPGVKAYREQLAATQEEENERRIKTGKAILQIPGYDPEV